MNDELAELIVKLQAELVALQLELEAAVKEYEAVEQAEAKEEAKPKKDMAGFNMWEERDRQLSEGMIPLAPVLEIPEFAEQYGDWYWDGDMAFIYKPLLDLRAKWLTGKGISFDNIKGDAGTRIRKYTALTHVGFASKFATVPEGFHPEPGYLDWLRLTRNHAQRVKVMYGGWKYGYAHSPVYDDFDSTVGSNAMDNDIVKPATMIPGIYYLTGGNLQDDETLLDAHKRACKSFEYFWSKYAGQIAMLNSVKWELRRLDREYDKIPKGHHHEDNAPLQEFLARNPAYVPVED